MIKCNETHKIKNNKMYINNKIYNNITLNSPTLGHFLSNGQNLVFKKIKTLNENLKSCFAKSNIAV